MASLNPLDTDAGTELFKGYEAEYQLVRADLAQKLDEAAELSGEPRKAALSAADRALEEAAELLGQMQMEKQNVPTASRAAINRRLRDYASDADARRRRLAVLADDRAALFGSRFRDDPDSAAHPSAAGGGGDAQLEQRQQLLSGTDRLDRSTQRLRASQALANETEEVGASTLADLHRQRETIDHTNRMLYETDGYLDRSIKTLRDMTRRMATNRLITISIITLLVLLIIIVIINNFR